MISDEYPDFGALSPSAFGGTPVKLHLSVSDVDRTFARAISKGAVEIRSVKDEFYGSRSGVLIDPYGHIWHVATKVEELGEEEMQRRWSESTT